MSCESYRRQHHRLHGACAATVPVAMPVSPATRRREAAIRSPARLLAVGLSRGTAALSRPWLLSSRMVVGCLAVIAVADFLIWRWKAPYAVEALLDEPAHAATGLVGLAAFGVSFEAPVVLAVLAGSLLIDLDHVPHVFGSHILEQGIPRPYTHSLGAILVLVAVAWLLRGRARRLVLIATLALGLHFFRDTAEPGGPGVSLVWPLSDKTLTIGYVWYAAALAALAAIALARRGGHETRGTESSSRE
jgi:hypothetical protein